MSASFILYFSVNFFIVDIAIYCVYISLFFFERILLVLTLRCTGVWCGYRGTSGPNLLVTLETNHYVASGDVWFSLSPTPS